MRQLTRRQAEILTFIRDYILEHNLSPTLREIGSSLGMRPPSVRDHLTALEKKGYIRRERFRYRSVEVVGLKRSFVQPALLPVLGRVPAGGPLLAFENIEETLALDRGFGKGLMFGLKVKGESMVEDGILDGDIVIIKKQEVAKNGDIVVARVNDEVTVKRLYREGNRIVLKPANSRMRPIVVRDGEGEVEVIGRVAGLLRRY